MEINKVHSDLKEIYKDKNVDKKFNFTFEYEDGDEKFLLMKLLKKGYWSVMPFAFSADNILAFQLNPNKERFQDTSIVSFNNTYQECFMISPNVKGIIPLTNLIFMHKEYFRKRLQDTIDEIILSSKPFFDYFGGGNLEFLKEFLLSESNQERFENFSEYKEDVYKEFWNHYYNTPENAKAFELFDQLIDDCIYLPEYENTDYGLWSNYIGNVLAKRAYSRITIEDVDKWKHYWHCAQLPHGFDGDDNSFEEYTIHLGHSSSLLDSLSDSFNSEWEEQYAILEK